VLVWRVYDFPLFSESFFLSQSTGNFLIFHFLLCLETFVCGYVENGLLVHEVALIFFPRFLIEWHLMSLSQRQVLLTFISDVFSREDAHVVFLSMLSQWGFVG